MLNDPLLGDDEQFVRKSSWSVAGRALLRTWVLAIPWGIGLAGIVCAAVWHFTETRYRSTAILQIVALPPTAVFPRTEKPSPDFAETQIELLRGSYLIGRALESDRLQELPELRDIADQEDAVQWVRKSLNVVRIGNSELYEVAFTAREPATAQRIVDSIVSRYMEFYTVDNDARRQRMLEVLDEELRLYDHKIEMGRAKLRELAKLAAGADVFALEIDSNGNVPAAGRSGLLQRLQQRLVEMVIEREVVRAHMTAAKEALDQPIQIRERRLAAALLREPEIRQLTREVKALRTKLSGLAPDDAAAATFREKLAAAEQTLEDRKQELRATLKAEFEEELAQERHDKLNQLTADLKMREDLSVLLKARIETEREAGMSQGDKSLELRFARDELAKVEDIRRQIADRSVHIQTESRAPDQVRAIQKATLPEFPEEPTREAVVVTAGTVAFLIPFVLCTVYVIVGRVRRKRGEG